MIHEKIAEAKRKLREEQEPTFSRADDPLKLSRSLQDVEEYKVADGYMERPEYFY